MNTEVTIDVSKDRKNRSKGTLFHTISFNGIVTFALGCDFSFCSSFQSILNFFLSFAFPFLVDISLPVLIVDLE